VGDRLLDPFLKDTFKKIIVSSTLDDELKGAKDRNLLERLDTSTLLGNLGRDINELQGIEAISIRW
jgi:hypothetical protein